MIKETIVYPGTLGSFSKLAIRDPQGHFLSWQPGFT